MNTPQFFLSTPVQYRRLVGHDMFSERANSYVRWYPKSLNPNFDAHQLIDSSTSVDGIYIHVPFCDVLCRFCPFNKVPSKLEAVRKFVQALTSEIMLYARTVDFKCVKFVYFGGGTPSVLLPGQFQSILNTLALVGVNLEACEVSMEAHPRHLLGQSLAAWKDMGFNRISSGIQALTDRELTLLGSHHTQRDAEIGLEQVSKYFKNYAIDLLYRFNGQSASDWDATLNKVANARIPHLSAYALVEPQLPSKQERLDEAEMATALDHVLHDAGYSHYASCASGGYDFCHPGHEGVYEKLHWQAPQATYLGLGPGAFGFAGGATLVNGLGIEAYCEALATDTLPLASVVSLTPSEARHRYFVLGVKTLRVSLNGYQSIFGERLPKHFVDVIQRLLQDGLIDATDEELWLTPVGRHYVDEVSTAFFSETQAGVIHPEEPEIRRAELDRRRLVGRTES